MKHSSWIGLLAAGGLLLTGCSSGGDTASSTTAAVTTAASTTAASTSSESAASSSSTPSAASSADDDTTGAEPAELDEATQTWFSTFCSSLANIAQYTGPDTAGQSVDQIKQTVVTAYTGISTEATAAAAALQPLPPPTIDSGAEIAAATTTGFQDLADVYGRGAQTIAASTPASDADLKAAVDAVEAEAQTASPNSLGDLDPSVEAAVKALPDCANVLSS